MRIVKLATALLALVSAPALAGEAMSVTTFLTKAESLKKKGALALFSGELKLLTDQVKADSVALRSENDALAKAGKAKSYCAPEGFGMDQDKVLEAMRAAPAAHRNTMSTKDALRAYLAARHPCR